MAKRDLGELGEDCFRAFCSSVGIVCNPSFVDKKGWDFFIQFDSEIQEVKFGSSEHACLVQVKATDGDSGRVQVFSSRLYNLAVFAGPAFLLCLEFDGKQSVQAAYLVELDKNLMAQATKAKPIGGKGRFKPEKITINYRQVGTALKTASGEGLLSCLKEKVGDDSYKYFQKKIAQIDELSTVKQPVEVEVTFSAQDPQVFYRELIAVAFGEKDDVEADSAEVSQIRFDQKKKTKTFQRVKIASKAPPIPARLTVYDSKGRGASMDVRILHPRSVFPFIPNEHLIIRIESDGFRLDLHPQGEQLQLKTDWKVLNFEQVRVLEKTLSMSLVGGRGELLLEARDKKYSYEVEWPKQPFTVDTKKLLDALGALIKLASQFSDLNHYQVSLADLEVASGNLNFIDFILSGKIPKNITCNLTSTSLEDGVEIRLRYPVSVPIVGSIFVMAIDLIGKVRESEGTFNLTPTRCEEFASKIFPRGQNARKSVGDWLKNTSEDNTYDEPLVLIPGEG